MTKKSGKQANSSAGKHKGTAKPGQAPDNPLHRRIHRELLAELEQKVWQPGDRLPSETALCKRFGASRITVTRAIQDLQRAGLVTRRVGSGTYVAAPARETTLQFGLLIPELGSTEIFGPICRGMVLSPQGRAHSLSWGGLSEAGDRSIEEAEQLCRQYIEQKVAGVFFAPMEHLPDSSTVNERIANALREAHVPVVLLDRTIAPFPEKDPYDCVSIDHYAAGFVLTRHLLDRGARRIVFLSQSHAASSVDARYAGYCRALDRIGPYFLAARPVSQIGIRHGNVEELQYILEEYKPDALLCANDRTAAAVMWALQTLGVRVPEDVRLVGIDDVRYAGLLPVPLTTVRQNCAELGAVAMATMLERVERPERPARSVQVDFELVVRASCGAGLPKSIGAG